MHIFDIRLRGKSSKSMCVAFSLRKFEISTNLILIGGHFQDQASYLASFASVRRAVFFANPAACSNLSRAVVQGLA
jgi:hypothetical protein